MLIHHWREQPHLRAWLGDPDDHRAVRAYEKAGFRGTGGPLDTLWGRALLMERHRSEQG